MSREVKAVIIDAVFSALVLVVSFGFLDPKWQELTLKLILIAQPVVVAIVLGDAVKQAAQVKYQDAFHDAMSLLKNIDRLYAVDEKEKGNGQE